MQIVNATDLARNTRQILDLVTSQGETVAIERNHTMEAHIMPALKTMTAAQALAGLKLPAFTPAQASTWLQDSKGNFGQEVFDPWA